MKVLVAGDFCPCCRVADLFEREDYGLVLDEVRCLTTEVDYSIVNLECPVVSGDIRPIEKHGPNLSCSNYGVKALKYSGFDCVTLANNHFLDFGEMGVQETIDALKVQGFDYVGGGLNIAEASRILYKEIGNLRIAIINCCEHEFSIATKDTAGSNPLNPIMQFYAIKEARNNADRVLVIVHGGHEHFRLPSPRMIETYRFFIDAGADAVVNHHQHCFSGYESYKGKPIFYGLGNFCFDDERNFSEKWTVGYAVSLDFSVEAPIFSLHPYIQCAKKPSVVILPNNALSEKIKELNAILSDHTLLSKLVNEYYDSCQVQYSSVFEPFFNRYYLAAKKRGLVPSLVSKKRKLLAADYVLCESHKDKLMYWLEK